MQNIARRHHFISQFYLAGFTDTREKDGHLYILDQETGRQFSNTPSNTAFQRDLYIVDDDSLPPDAIERRFGLIEATVAPVLQKTLLEKRFPTNPAAHVALIYFVALQLARTPKHRKVIEDMITKRSEYLETPEQFADILMGMHRMGIVANPELANYEEFKRYMIEGERDAALSQSAYLKYLLLGTNMATSMLLHRRWRLMVIKDKNLGGFICSDNPVSSFFPGYPDYKLYGVGLGDPNIEITMPLGQDCMLIGRLAGGSMDYGGEIRTVAALNYRTGIATERFVYSETPNFIWRMRNGQLGNIDNLLAAIKRTQKRT